MPAQYDVPEDVRFEAATPFGVISGEIPAGVHDAESLSDDARYFLDVVAAQPVPAPAPADEPAPKRTPRKPEPPVEPPVDNTQEPEK